MKRICITIAMILVLAGTAAAMEFSAVQRDSIDVITIKKSGFMNNEEIVIKFRSDDHSIVSVVDKGEQVPKEQWHNYRSLLWSYLELRNVEELRPKIEKIRQVLLKSNKLQEKEIERMVLTERRLDSLRSRLERSQTRNADRLLEETLRMESRLAEVREKHEAKLAELHEKQIVLTVKHEKLTKFLSALEDADIISDTEDVTIKFRNNICKINGKLMSEKVTEQIRDIYRNIFGEDLDEDKFTIIKSN